MEISFFVKWNLLTFIIDIFLAISQNFATFQKILWKSPLQFLKLLPKATFSSSILVKYFEWYSCFQQVPTSEKTIRLQGIYTLMDVICKDLTWKYSLITLFFVTIKQIYMFKTLIRLLGNFYSFFFLTYDHVGKKKELRFYFYWKRSTEIKKILCWRILLLWLKEIELRHH